MAPEMRPLFKPRRLRHASPRSRATSPPPCLPDIIVAAVLKGGFIFAADLLRAKHDAGVTSTVDFMRLASYGAGTESSGNVRVRFDLEVPVVGRPVLIVDDILDSGRTLAFVRDLLASRGAEIVKVCCQLDKPARRTIPVEAAFVGFVCSNAFLVGYGLDYGERYRDLPYVGVLATTASD